MSTTANRFPSLATRPTGATAGGRLANGRGLCAAGIACALAFGSLGCGDRGHLTESHGRAYRELLARQAANPNAGRERREVRGLDAQEAQIVAGTYRRQLTPKSAVVAQERPMMILASPRREEAYVPPPSVPQER